MYLSSNRTVGERQQAQQADINTNRFAFTRFGLRRCKLDLIAHIPFAVAALENDVLDLRAFGQRAVVLNLDFTHILDVKQCPARIVKAQLAAVAVFVFQTFEAVAAFEARETRLFASFEAAKLLSRRRSICCTEVALSWPSVSGLA